MRYFVSYFIYGKNNGSGTGNSVIETSTPVTNTESIKILEKELLAKSKLETPEIHRIVVINFQPLPKQDA